MTQIEKFKNIKELISFFECGGEGIEECLLKDWASFGVFVLTDEEYNTELEKSKKKLKKLINKVRKELASYRYTFNGL